jgi:nucleoside-diphosphate-sugar epimerase
MSESSKAALILGAASPLGAALACAINKGDYDQVFLADSPTKRGVLSAILSHMKISKESVRIVESDVRLPFAGLTVPDAFRHMSADIFHAAHRMDRTLPAADIHPHNTLALERIFSIAHAVENLGSVTVITDVGTAGDYPSRFSEAWTDAGQTPFDDADKSSLQIERACLEETGLPIIRARVGLVLLPPRLKPLFQYWRTTSKTLLGSVQWLAKLPKFLTIPAAVAEGSFAPVTPADWAGRVLLHLAREEKARRNAYHLIVDPKPPIETVLNAAADILGGARIKGGLPVNLIAKLGRVPGFKETARRSADQVASWWTPHRYCLSINDLDTAHLRSLLPLRLFVPTWDDVKDQMT